MKRVTIVPGLVVDEEMFAQASGALAAYAPGQSLTWEQFVDPLNWKLAPNEEGFGYRGELTLINSIDLTLKVNLWIAPDLRGGQMPKPHNHPWEYFQAHILMGGYDEYRYQLAGNSIEFASCQHLAGGVNGIHRPTFHEVTEIHEPGRTLTLMICGRGQMGQWGYLDLDSAQFVLNQPDPHFRENFLRLNPQYR